MSTNSITRSSTFSDEYQTTIRRAAQAILQGNDGLARRLYGAARRVARQAANVGNRALLLDFLERNV